MKSLFLLQQEGTGPGPDWQWGSCHIPRGDLQTTFLFKGFDEARRLGLSHSAETEVRAAIAADMADTQGVGKLSAAVEAAHDNLI